MHSLHSLDMMDEYWHPHVDMNSTSHYHYSGLLYLSTYSEDFTGGKMVNITFIEASEFRSILVIIGRLTFLDNYYNETHDTYKINGKLNDLLAKPRLILEPKAGRVAIFTAGPEHTHYVEKIGGGERFTLSFWFTCDNSKQFDIFLDGKAHFLNFKKRMDSTEKASTFKNKVDL